MINGIQKKQNKKKQNKKTTTTKKQRDKYLNKKCLKNKKRLSYTNGIHIMQKRARWAQL